MQINRIGSYMPKAPSFQGGKVTLTPKGRSYDAWYLRSTHDGYKNEHPYVEFYTDDNGNHTNSFINPKTSAGKAEALIKSVQTLEGENNHLDLSTEAPVLTLENGEMATVDFVEGRMVATQKVLGTKDELEIYYSDEKPAVKRQDPMEDTYYSERIPLVKLENGEEHAVDFMGDYVLDYGKVLNCLG